MRVDSAGLAERIGWDSDSCCQDSPASVDARRLRVRKPPLLLLDTWAADNSPAGREWFVKCSAVFASPSSECPALEADTSQRAVPAVEGHFQ